MSAAEFIDKVVVWADGPDRDIDDHAGVRQDIARALGAPTNAVHVVRHQTNDNSVVYTVLIDAPRCDRSEPALDEVPW